MYLANGIVGIKRKQRCGSCDACSKDDCGQCTNCRDMIKFGGTGRKKKCCVQRQCKNIHDRMLANSSELQVRVLIYSLSIMRIIKGITYD